MEANALASLSGLLSQGSRFLTLDTCTEDDLLLERLNGKEGLNTLSRFELNCISPSAFIPLKPLLGSPVRIGMATDTGIRRYWHGYVTQSSSLGADGGLSRYRLIVESSLAFLETRRNSLIFQDKTALDIVRLIFADYDKLAWRNDSTISLKQRVVCTQYRETDLDFVKRLLAEEGLSWYIEHDQQPGENSDGPGHTLVIIDAAAGQALPAGMPSSIRFHRVDATEKHDSITRFAERRQINPNQITLASWAPDQLQAVTGNAQSKPLPEAPDIPDLDQFDADATQAFANSKQADTEAQHRLDAARMMQRQFSGQGAVRTLTTGRQYVLTQHPDLDGQAFVPIHIEHHATNNLSTDLPDVDGQQASANEKGIYRNRFVALPMGTRMAPAFPTKPAAPACTSAIVTGVPKAALTGTRDHQVRIQFYWQRGKTPLPGGQTDTQSKNNPDGHATQDEKSGTWVRVAEAAAGANHGQSFVPRIGNDVLVEFAQGDIDQPVIVGQLYNGQTLPPFSAGENSTANHPGTLSGIQTCDLDGALSASWVIDDASGQLRQQLAHSLAHSQLNLGYLIAQQGSYRGSYLGEGVELKTDGWEVIRAGEGLFLTTAQRAMGQSTQMDATESLGQLKAAHANAEQLSSAAGSAGAADFKGNTAQKALIAMFDSQQDGKYSGKVARQSATKPAGNVRDGGDPVERFAKPAILLDTPDSMAFTTPESLASFAGEYQHLTAQTDIQVSSAKNLSIASGNTASAYAPAGDINAIANQGNASIEAHDGELDILADKNVTIASSTTLIDIKAQQKVVLAAGGATITLQGANILINCPGAFNVTAPIHHFDKGMAQPAVLKPLPKGPTTIPPATPPSSEKAAPAAIADAAKVVVPGVAASRLAMPGTAAISEASKPTKGGQQVQKNNQPSLIKPVYPLTFHIVKKASSRTSLLNSLYTNLTPAIDEFVKSINPALSNNLEPGQLLILSHPDGLQDSNKLCKMQSDQVTVEQQRKQLDGNEQKLVIDYFDLINDLSSYASSGVGFYALKTGKQAELIQGKLKEIENLHKDTYAKYKNLNHPEFFLKRKVLFKQLDNHTARMLLNRSGFENTELTKIKKVLGLSPKSMLHQWNQAGTSAGGIKGYADNYTRVAKYAKHIRRVGYVGIALDGLHSVNKIAEACTIGREDECERVSFEQTGRFVGSTAGGVLAAEGTYVACNTLLGIESFGTSLLFCAIPAAIAGYLGGSLAGSSGKYAGNSLYKITSKVIVNEE